MGIGSFDFLIPGVGGGNMKVVWNMDRISTDSFPASVCMGFGICNGYEMGD